MKAIIIEENRGKYILTTAICYKDLYPIVKFTHRIPSDIDPYSNKKDNSNEYYQRVINSDKTKEMVKFIRKSFEQRDNNEGNNNIGITTIFPSSIIIALDIDHLKIIDDNFVDINLPINKGDDDNVALLVDGQHRMAAMKSLRDQMEKHLNKAANDENDRIINSIDDYKFNCTLLINFDLWEQAQLFANVNFKQKPVNKSLYYEIFGSLPPEKSIDNNSGLFIVHNLVLHLNNNKKSPLHGYIKILGTGKGYFSQAFLVDAILKHFRNQGIWNKIEEDYKNNGKKYKILSKVFITYFNAIKKVFSEYWPNNPDEKYNHILVKTTGMGGLIKLLDPIYRKLSLGIYRDFDTIDFTYVNNETLENIFINIFSPISNSGKELFSKEGKFSGSGGSGLQSKLFKELSELLEL